MTNLEINTKQDNLWMPVLEKLGYRRPIHAGKALDMSEGVDILAGGFYFAVRTRDLGKYAGSSKFIQEFTIRSRLASGYPTEWDKLFLRKSEYIPDRFAYGWDDGKTISIGVIMDIPTMQKLHVDGRLELATGPEIANRGVNDSYFRAVHIPTLCNLMSEEETDSLFLHWSFNHPAQPNPAPLAELHREPKTRQNQMFNGYTDNTQYH